MTYAILQCLALLQAANTGQSPRVCQGRLNQGTSQVSGHRCSVRPAFILKSNQVKSILKSNDVFLTKNRQASSL